MNNNLNNYSKQEKIMLSVLPFLTPICPPVGISCLKSTLEKNGYNVKTIDAMSNMDIREACYKYFNTLESYIPVEKRGHFFNVALDVLNNHFMAHINYLDEKKYIELVELVVYQNFYINIDIGQIKKLNEIVLNFYTKLEEFIKEIVKTEQPTVYGISVYRGTLAASLFAVRTVKKNFPKIKTVMGGAIFSQELHMGTPNYESFMKQADCVDKILIGEGENLFVKFMDGKLPENKKVYTLDDIDNELAELDNLDIPDYSDFDLSTYPLLPAYTSRGCVYQCSFCAETIYWKKYRKKSVFNIADTFEKMSKKYDKNILLLTDCLINPVVTELSEEIIKRRLSVYWDVYLKVDDRVCDPEFTFLWRKGGFYRARLGIESGSQKVLDLIDKRITLEQIKKAIRCLANAGIKTTTYWIAGHPGETEEDYQMTLDLLDELHEDIYEAEADPFRYFYNGQVDADKWMNGAGNSLLYPAEMSDMLLTQTWKLNTYPEREVIYDRACRFREHCKKLGIPNPYSVSEIYKADERWKKLHLNAVPALLDMDKKNLIKDDIKNISRITEIKEFKNDDIEFMF